MGLLGWMWSGQTVKQYLLECTRYVVPRDLLHNELLRLYLLPILHILDVVRDAVNAVLRYVRDTGKYRWL